MREWKAAMACGEIGSAAAVYAMRRRADAAPPPRNGEARRLRAGCGELCLSALLARPLLSAAAGGSWKEKIKAAHGQPGRKRENKFLGIVIFVRKVINKVR